MLRKILSLKKASGVVLALGLMSSQPFAMNAPSRMFEPEERWHVYGEFYMYFRLPFEEVRHRLLSSLPEAMGPNADITPSGPGFCLNVTVPDVRPPSLPQFLLDLGLTSDSANGESDEQIPMRATAFDVYTNEVGDPESAFQARILVTLTDGVPGARGNVLLEASRSSGSPAAFFAAFERLKEALLSQ